MTSAEERIAITSKSRFSDAPAFRRRLLHWYDRNKRDLPWRRVRDPYDIWVSEIMLQQTRVAAVRDYYVRFMERFPNVRKLAAARLDEILAVWSGLGYYRRARFLHLASIQIVKERGGNLPTSAAEWQELAGIGPYTAAAIASIAFDEPVAVVDGNVERVLSRLIGASVKGKRSWTLAQTLLPSVRPGDFNQAMMELGATVCLPRDPRCLVCPVNGLCVTRGELSGIPTSPRNKRDLFYGLNFRAGKVLLRQRSVNSSLMAGMWELPEIPRPGQECRDMLKLRHSITNTDYLVRVYQDVQLNPDNGRWFSKSRVSGLPLTGLARKILRTAGVI